MARKIMASRSYYNEHDPFAAAWLRELIKEGLIADGDVDTRSIEDVTPGDLAGYTQIHLFAGIGGWSRALRLAGVADDFPVWTGSAPCFPEGVLIFSKRGNIPIEQVCVGDEVLTHKGRWRKVSATGSSISSMVCVKGQGHFGLKTTSDHPFLTGEGEWTPAGQLKGKKWSSIAKVPYCSTIPQFNTEIGAEVRGAQAADPTSLGFARFLGFWVGNGWVTGGNRILICDDIKNESLVREIMEGARLHGYVSIERTAARACCGSANLAGWLTSHFGSGAPNKRIPVWLHEASREYRESFLRGYQEADGHCAIQPRSGGLIHAWTTTSRALAIGVRILLNQSGISASIKETKTTPTCVIEGRTVRQRDWFRITAYERARSFSFSSLHGRGVVRSVSECESGTVYNLAVEEDESYCADGIVVHNCQPFSAAGKRAGTKDKRHLWPVFYELIKACRPKIIMGEQVSGKLIIGERGSTKKNREKPDSSSRPPWFDSLASDLEAAHYSVGAASLSASAVGAPHIRQRLYWVGLRKGALDNAANARYNDEGQHDGGSPLRPSRSEQSSAFSALGIADRAGWLQGQPAAAPAGHGGSAEPASGLCGMANSMHPGRPEWRPGAGSRQAAGRSGFDELADTGGAGLEERRVESARTGLQAVERSGLIDELADTSSAGLRPRGRRPEEGNGTGPAWKQPGRFRDVGESFWGEAEWIPCIDGKWRPIEAASAQPKLRALADGVPEGMERSGRADQPSQKAANEEARSTFPVVHGYPNRIGALRGYGNAIVPPLAAIFIQSVLGDKTT